RDGALDLEASPREDVEHALANFDRVTGAKGGTLRVAGGVGREVDGFAAQLQDVGGRRRGDAGAAQESRDDESAPELVDGLKQGGAPGGGLLPTVGQALQVGKRN